MSALASQVVKESGLTPAYVAGASGGDTVTPSAAGMLHVKNTSGGAITVTVDDVGTPIPGGSASNPDLVVSIPATTGDKMIGPITPERFARASDGQAAITYSVNPPTGLTLAYIIGPGRG